jgi:hypothetical protein
MNSAAEGRIAIAKITNSPAPAKRFSSLFAVWPWISTGVPVFIGKMPFRQANLCETTYNSAAYSGVFGNQTQLSLNDALRVTRLPRKVCDPLA